MEDLNMRQKLEQIIAVTGASLILIILTAVTARAGSGSTHLTREDLMRRSSAGGITIQVVFLTPLERDNPDIRDGLRFQVTLDTHFGNLMKFDLAKVAELRTSGDVNVNSDFIWEPESESSHHRTGVLRVSEREKGNALFTEEADSIELVLKEIAVPTRTFTWTMEELEGRDGSSSALGTQEVDP
jgi:hypothetical protein